VGGTGWSVGACFVDYDLDGHIDLIVSRYLDWDFDQNIYCGDRREGYRAYCHPDRFKPTSHLVYHNNGDGTFTDVSKACGIGAVPSKGLGIAINDFDRDGWPDVFINALAMQRYALFQNRKGKAFDYVSGESGISRITQTHSGRGAKFIDYDNDGWKDLFVVLPAALLSPV
ncbi:MAG: VCBS repeat-containing protein, partial [Acidobacteriota bacterium]|nr:VCBS repeat-containing protein [Acidobacteriota bacterium]